MNHLPTLVPVLYGGGGGDGDSDSDSDSDDDGDGNVTTREYDPVYDISQQPKQLVAGIQIELLVALIIALLVVCVVCIGLLYNCLRRRAPVKDLELSHSKYDPVYDISQQPKQLVAGIQIELLVALI